MNSTNYFYISVLLFLVLFTSCNKDKEIGSETLNTIENSSYFTEDFPPFNYQQGSKNYGVSVDLLLEIWNEMGVSLSNESIQLTDWASAYSKVEKENNSMLFSTARIPEREDKFKWVGPIAPIKESLIALVNGNIEIKNDEELLSYKIGAIEGYSNIDLLKELGIDNNKLVLVSNAEELYQKLINKEVECIAFLESAGQIIAQSLGHDLSEFESVYNLKTTDVYYAFNLNTSDDVIDTFQSTLEKLKNDRTEDGSTVYEKTLNRYSIINSNNDNISDQMVLDLVNTTCADIELDQNTTIQKINNGETPYLDPDVSSLYSFVYDTTATMIAHSTNASLVGVSLKGKADVTGKKFRDEIIASALKNGSGWVDYVYTKPEQGGLFQKTTYFKLCTGSKGDSFVVCAGKYK